MGREAICHVEWAGESGQAKVLIETQDLIVRAAGKLSRRAVPIASLTQVEARNGRLHFRAGADPVTLTLGEKEAESWARKLTSPPPTLAAKLGIGGETRLAILGNLDTEELAEAVAQAASRESRQPDLILALVKNRADLDYALDCYAGFPAKPPIWIVYPKGAGKPIGETEIRNTMRQTGLMDTKIASVSATLTALRFHACG